MSISKFLGGLITKNPPTPSGPYQNSTAPGMWTLTQVANYIKQALWPTAGNVNPDSFIENLFSTYLYTGNDSVQTITNGIDLAGKGGLIWLKKRNNTSIHGLWDTARGGGSRLDTSSTAAAGSVSPAVTFNSNGFTLPAGGSSYLNESSTNTYVSWTFREQAKFFDVVTYTGDGVAGRTVPHNLGSVPGVIIVKLTTSSQNWRVYHRALGATQYLELDGTGAAATLSTIWNNTAPTSTVFSVGTNSSVNNSGSTYVAYLFAHNAGGFGLSGAENVISCGSYVGNGSATGPVINLGYEPQWLMTKNASTELTQNWLITDNMRGFYAGATNDAQLFANLTNAEGGANRLNPTATGFDVVSANSEVNFSGETYIYIAIRRGLMKTPTTGTSVFSPQLQTAPGGSYVMAGSSGFPVDWLPTKKTAVTNDWFSTSRLTSNYLQPNTSAAEGVFTYGFDLMQGVSAPWDAAVTASYAFRRAAGFFDVVAYTGTGSAGVVLNHNLTVAPELLITKIRNFAGEDWIVHYNNGSSIIGGYLNSTSAFANSSTAPSTDVTSFTATTYTLNTSNRRVNGVYNYVAYLFATVAGVSKVGSYVGNGSSQTIPCGFTSGSRFVMIKRTDNAGDWYVWDSARGIVAGNDPHLSVNTTAAEVTTDDSVDTDSTGFVVNQVAATNVNVTSATYIFLAIA